MEKENSLLDICNMNSKPESEAVVFDDGKEKQTLTYRQMLDLSDEVCLFFLTHSLVVHFETVPNSKKLQTTTEMWLLMDFKI